MASDLYLAHDFNTKLLCDNDWICRIWDTRIFDKQRGFLRYEPFRMASAHNRNAQSR